MLRPLYGVEVFDGETARFEVELSEDDIHGQWKLNGEVLSPSAVCPLACYLKSYDLVVSEALSFSLTCFLTPIGRGDH